jgi:hypothetical protein
MCPEAVQDYVSCGWVGESHVVYFAHLLDLQFETSWWEEMA